MFKFRPSTIPTNIFVVGCGGTGSRLVPALVQFIRSITKEHNPTGWLGSTNIVLIDGDIVEQKNLLRQNFIANDVNKNKAAVLANRYGKHFEMNVVAYPKFIEKGMRADTFRRDVADTCGITLDQHTNDMVIMCVDSAEARRIVLTALAPVMPNKRSVYIDAGNEDAFGQVRMFTNTILAATQVYGEGEFRKKYKAPERIAFSPDPLFYIPYDHEFYENLQDNPGLGSCADLDQTLAINSMMAMMILSFVQNYYYNKVIDYNEMSIDIGAGSSVCTKNTITNYRNKTLPYSHKDYSKIAGGLQRGFVGSCSVVNGEVLFEDFLVRNDRELKLIEERQTAPTLEEVKAAPKAKKAKKKVEEVVAIGEIAIEEEIFGGPTSDPFTASSGIPVPVVFSAV